MKNDNLTQLIQAAFLKRADLIQKLEAEGTDTWRIFHGINEGCPGLTIDRYGKQVLIQSFREPLDDAEIKEIKAVVSHGLGFSPRFVYHDRSEKNLKDQDLERTAASESSPVLSECRELGVTFQTVDIFRGQDPLLFIDLRSARRFLMKQSKGKSVLNLFAYTCGAGVAAAVAGAREVWNVDFAKSSLDYGRANALLNQITDERIRFIQQDVIAMLRQLSGLGIKGKARLRPIQKFTVRTFDIVFMDPPTLAKSAFGVVDIIRDYQGIFKPALLCVAPGGLLICTNHAPEVELEIWLDQLKRCAEKAGRPITDIQVIEPEPDFPSPDGKFPLKVAVCRL